MYYLFWSKSHTACFSLACRHPVFWIHSEVTIYSHVISLFVKDIVKSEGTKKASESEEIHREGPSIRLEIEVVGHISNKKQLEAPHRKKIYRMRYAEDSCNSYFSLSKFKTKRFIQICWHLEISKSSNRNPVIQYIIRPRYYMPQEIRTEQYLNRIG